jgi:hypothetical protein
MKIKLCAAIFLLLACFCKAQLPYGLIDGRDHHYCAACKYVIKEMPVEVLFGIQINSNGDIFFSMNNKEWFEKIFKNNSYGVCVDLVSNDSYGCNKVLNNTTRLPKGIITEPVYRPELIKGVGIFGDGSVFVKVGKVPQGLKNKDIEGNLTIVNGTYICYYSNFVNIDRSLWKLLPMGLFTDSLLQINEPENDNNTVFFPYSKKIEAKIFFPKSGSALAKDYLIPAFDSLRLSNYKIKKTDIRAYSSVEGNEKKNIELIRQRANSVINFLQKNQVDLKNIHVVYAENWLDFFNEIEGSEFNYLKDFSKPLIKQKLTDTLLLNKIEPILKKERAVLTTLYLDTKSSNAEKKDSTLINEFSKAVETKSIKQAREILKEISDRIIDKRLPLEFIHKLEVPETKEYSPLLSDKEVYKFLLKATDEWQALEKILALQKLDPINGNIAYNICTLRFFTWQNGGDTTVPKLLYEEINKLSKLHIDSILVKRLFINFFILSSEDKMKVFDYKSKDSLLSLIYDLYETAKLKDEEIYSMAKYFSFYSRQDWANDIIEPRIDKPDVNEDLLFYYINLTLFKPDLYGSELFKKACINAISLNKERFCKFFLPSDKGGASMQLLDSKVLKKVYCEECNK